MKLLERTALVNNKGTCVKDLEKRPGKAIDENLQTGKIKPLENEMFSGG